MISSANSPVKVKCKQCGRMANSTEFVLDAVFKMLVCPSCIKDRRAQVNKPKVEAKPESPKPAGWDREDEELSKSYAQKQKETVTAKKIDADHVMFTCRACKYEFRYNVAMRRPGRCPYCGQDVPEKIQSM